MVHRYHLIISIKCMYAYAFWGWYCLLIFVKIYMYKRRRKELSLSSRRRLANEGVSGCPGEGAISHLELMHFVKRRMLLVIYPRG